MSKKPKFITILMDDMGWTNLSYCGSNFYESHNLVDEMPEKAADCSHFSTIGRTRSKC